MDRTAPEKQAQRGDREAFRAAYAAHARGVYLRARGALGSDEAARAVVKQVFLNLHYEQLRAGGEINVAARVEALTDDELVLRRLLGRDTNIDSRHTPNPALVSGSRGEAARSALAADHDALDELPALDRARAYMRHDHSPAQAAPAPVQERRRRGWFLTLLLMLILLLLLWSLSGVAMDFGWIPTVNLGYSWFNEHIFEFFLLGQ